MSAALSRSKKDCSQKSNHLIFVGKGEFKNQWRDKFQDGEEVKDAMRKGSELELLHGKISRTDTSLVQLQSILDSIRISFASYQMIGLFLMKEKASLKKSEAAETLSKLIDGMIQELKDRSLLKTE